MNNQSSWVKTAATLCLEFGEEDGIDPRYLARNSARKPSSHKLMQICKETGRIVSLLLADAVNRPLLNDLQVVSVLPEQNGVALCVTVAHEKQDFVVTEKEIVAALKPLQGLFRSVLAQTINRKHTTQLTFRYAGVIIQGGG
jgi:ribosome-binding factor A